MIDLVNFGGQKIVYMLKMGGFEMRPNIIWTKRETMSHILGGKNIVQVPKMGGKTRSYLLTLKEGVPPARVQSQYLLGALSLSYGHFPPRNS